MEKINHLIKTILLILFLSPILLYAQKENNIWYFGDKAGVDFNSGSPMAITNSNMSTLEGCASVSDNNGALLFYTDGNTIWNKNHVTMPNGTGLLGGGSSTQSAIIVKKPGVNSIYYIFTVDQLAGSNGLKYTEVDINLLAGLGDVNANKNIDLSPSTCEKISLINHTNGTDYWVVIHLYNSNTFNSFLISATGVSLTPVVSNSGTSISGDLSNTIGYMKSSPNGKLLAMANREMKIAELFDFDATTGIISNAVTLSNFVVGGGPYGVEFSPFSDLLYVSDYSNIYQYNVLAGYSTQINSSRIVVGNLSKSGGALQMGPDHKVYHAPFSGNYLGVINDPTLQGLASNYVDNGVFLDGKQCKGGLPSFVNRTDILPQIDLGEDTILCVTDYIIDATTINATYLWNDGSTEKALTVTETGEYWVKINVNGFENADTINVVFDPLILANLGDITTILERDTLVLSSNSNATSFLWQDGSTNATFNVIQPDTFHVQTYYLSCTSTDTIVITCENTLEMANIFTPNGDGLNDSLYPTKYGCILNSSIIIYNRWGLEVYENEDISVGWDGGDYPDGAYYWVIKYQDINEKRYFMKGWVTILR